MIDLPPPHSLEDEEFVLGCILSGDVSPADVSEIISGNDLYGARSRPLWDACKALEDQGRVITLSSTRDALTAAGVADRVGEDYLYTCRETPNTTKSWAHYAKEVKAYSIRRQLLAFGHGIVQRATEGAGNKGLDRLIDELEQEMFAVGRVQGVAVEDTASLLKRVFADIEDRAKNPGIRGLLTGFPAVDDILGGMMPGQNIILAARPGLGKTTKGMNIALRQIEARTLFISHEMEPEEMALNAACCVAEVDATRAQRGTLTPEERERIQSKATAEHVGLITFASPPSANPQMVRAMVRRQIAKDPSIGLVVVDYLQLMCDPTNESVSIASREMKRMAREVKRPLLLLSQLNRGVEFRDDKRPMLGDLRDSGSIEQDADKVAFLYRDGYYNDNPGDQTCEVIVAKNRGGQCGTAKVRFIPNQLRFTV